MHTVWSKTIDWNASQILQWDWRYQWWKYSANKYVEAGSDGWCVTLANEIASTLRESTPWLSHTFETKPFQSWLAGLPSELFSAKTNASSLQGLEIQILTCICEALCLDMISCDLHQKVQSYFQLPWNWCWFVGHEAWVGAFMAARIGIHCFRLQRAARRLRLRCFMKSLSRQPVLRQLYRWHVARRRRLQRGELHSLLLKGPQQFGRRKHELQSPKATPTGSHQSSADIHGQKYSFYSKANARRNRRYKAGLRKTVRSMLGFRIVMPSRKREIWGLEKPTKCDDYDLYTHLSDCWSSLQMLLHRIHCIRSTWDLHAWRQKPS